MNREHEIRKDDRRGIYFIRIQRDGVQKYFNLGSNKKKAVERLKEIEDEINAGKIVFIEPTTTQTVTEDGRKDVQLAELIHKHLKWFKANRAAGTFVNRQHYLQQFLDFTGPCMVSEISKEKLMDFHAWAKKKGRSENGGNEALANVKAALKWAAEEVELCELSFRQFPKMHHVPPDTNRIFESDLKQLKAAAKPDFWDILEFAMITGLRPKELVELQWSHVQTNSAGQQYLLIRRHKTERTAGIVRPRSVVLSSSAQGILKRQQEHHPASSYVFLNAKGTPYKSHALTTRITRLSSRAQTSRTYSTYSLRHTFASVESEAGVETTGLSKMMGHSTTRTLERYVTNTHQHYFECVQAADKYLDRVFKKDEKKAAS